MPSQLFDHPYDTYDTYDTPPNEPPRREGPPAPPGPAGRPPRRRGVVLLAVVASVFGGLFATGALLTTGALHTGGKTTTVIEPTKTVSTSSTSSTSGGSSTGLTPAQLYAGSAAGVVDITSKSVSSTGDSPFSPGGSGESTATGTGSVLDSQGRILTAQHVVSGASSITVTFQDGTTRTAKVLGEDSATDVAVIKVDPAGLTLHPLPLGNSASLSVGDTTMIIGDPFAYRRSLSTGVVSGLDRTIEAPNGFTVAHAIQTDASMNPGNSGGPVFDGNGRVIGIADQIATGGSGVKSSTGVGFAVPIDIVRSELSQLESGAKVTHAYLGVSTADATSSSGGVLVQSVRAGSPAEQAGLRTGDVVTSIAGKKVTGSNDLVAAIDAHKPGETVDLVVQRGGQTMTLHATLAAQPQQTTTGG